MAADCCPLDACVETVSSPPPDPRTDEAVARVAKALGHPARLRILRFLAQRSACFGGDIVASLDLAQSTVSEHLRILRDAGLVKGEIEHPRVCYCLDLAAFQRHVALLAGLVTIAASAPDRGGLS